jgi:membrane-bound ClpP family serine protease
VSRTFLRYLLWQVPGWLLVGLLLMMLCALAGLSLWIVVLGVAAFVVKDVLMYRVVGSSFEPAREGLLGARGRAVERLAPGGWVRVEGELWRAETVGGEIEAGAEIVVRGARGLTLRVEAVRPA